MTQQSKPGEKWFHTFLVCCPFSRRVELKAFKTAGEEMLVLAGMR